MQGPKWNQSHPSTPSNTIPAPAGGSWSHSHLRNRGAFAGLRPALGAVRHLGESTGMTGRMKRCQCQPRVCTDYGFVWLVVWMAWWEFVAFFLASCIFCCKATAVVKYVAGLLVFLRTSIRRDHAYSIRVDSTGFSSTSLNFKRWISRRDKKSYQNKVKKNTTRAFPTEKLTSSCTNMFSFHSQRFFWKRKRK